MKTSLERVTDGWSASYSVDGVKHFVATDVNLHRVIHKLLRVIGNLDGNCTLDEPEGKNVN